jgi:hypothetical protein
MGLFLTDCLRVLGRALPAAGAPLLAANDDDPSSSGMYCKQQQNACFKHINRQMTIHLLCGT